MNKNLYCLIGPAGITTNLQLVRGIRSKSQEKRKKGQGIPEGMEAGGSGSEGD